jgi:predicted DNA repair protein MutK
MASGLVALLDDIVAVTRLAAASIDDVAAAAGKAGKKAAGIVIDDAAVTPGYAIGFAPERELPIIWKIARGSLRNKFLILLPGALLLAAYAAWAVTPLLLVGGAFLCFEATEKIVEALAPGHHDVPVEAPALDAAEREARKVRGAIRTDFILSGEIMAIALATVTDRPFVVQAGALIVVGLVVTIVVYGLVGLIVKMDDVGLRLATRDDAAIAAVGRGLVRAMPVLMSVLAVVGTAAMLWVGGGILVHGLETFGVGVIPALVHGLEQAGQSLPGVGPIVGWLGYATGCALVGLVAGGLLVAMRLAVRSRPGAAVA